MLLNYALRFSGIRTSDLLNVNCNDQQQPLDLQLPEKELIDVYDNVLTPYLFPSRHDGYASSTLYESDENLVSSFDVESLDLDLTANGFDVTSNNLGFVTSNNFETEASNNQDTVTSNNHHVVVTSNNHVIVTSNNQDIVTSKAVEISETVEMVEEGKGQSVEEMNKKKKSNKSLSLMRKKYREKMSESDNTNGLPNITEISNNKNNNKNSNNNNNNNNTNNSNDNNTNDNIHIINKSSDPCSFDENSEKKVDETKSKKSLSQMRKKYREKMKGTDTNKEMPGIPEKNDIDHNNTTTNITNDLNHHNGHGNENNSSSNIVNNNNNICNSNDDNNNNNISNNNDNNNNNDISNNNDNNNTDDNAETEVSETPVVCTPSETPEENGHPEERVTATIQSKSIDEKENEKFPEASTGNYSKPKKRSKTLMSMRKKYRDQLSSVS